MILPTTQLSVLLLLVLSLLCWGSWANTFKATRSWRFEYFYYDFTWGVLLTAAIAAFTLGTLDQQELTFEDNLVLAAYRKIAWAAGSGVVFNLGNIFLLSGVALSGMSVAFPIALGTAMVVGAILNFAGHPQISIVLVALGIVLVVAAMLTNIVAYRWRIAEQKSAAVAPLQPDPRARGARPTVRPWRGIVLAFIGGLLLAGFFPMLNEAMAGETGVASYPAALLVAGGVAVSTLFYVPFFLAFPVIGEPGQVRGYFKGDKKQHVLGVLGGILWTGGLIAGLVAAGVPSTVQPGQIVQYALSHAAFLIAALWGIVVWREFKGASYRVNVMLTATLVLFLAGLGMVAVAPLYAG